jgi:hypothetical protein
MEDGTRGEGARRAPKRRGQLRFDSVCHPNRGVVWEPRDYADPGLIATRGSFSSVLSAALLHPYDPPIPPQPFVGATVILLSSFLIVLVAIPSNPDTRSGICFSHSPHRIEPPPI